MSSSKLSLQLIQRLRRMESDDTFLGLVLSNIQPYIHQLPPLQERNMLIQERVETWKTVASRSAEGAIDTAITELTSTPSKRWRATAELLKPVEAWLVHGFVMQLTRDAVDRLVERDDVAAVVENFTVQFPDPLTPQSQEIVEEARGITWGLEMMQVPEVWQQGYTGKGIRIGHLDTGVDPAHPDLTGKIARWMSFDQFGSQLLGVPIFDSHMHGTHTAGVMVGGTASGKAIGVAPDAHLLSAQVLPYGRGNLAQIILGAQWVLSEGADIVNMSLGGVGYQDVYELIVPGILRSGAIPVVAIGNNGIGVTGSPANNKETCGVGAINHLKEVADFSGGGSFDLVQNGEIIRYTKPDVCAPGTSIFSSVPRSYGALHQYLSGTSMAAPHVSGILALLREARLDLPATDIIQAVYDTCEHDMGAGSHDNRHGRGIISPLRALERIMEL